MRFFLLHTTPQLAQVADPPPMLVALHGGGGNAQFMDEHLAIDDVADREGFVVAYGATVDLADTIARFVKDKTR